MIGSLLIATDNNIKRRKDVYSSVERRGRFYVVLSCPVRAAEKMQLRWISDIEIANGRKCSNSDGNSGFEIESNRLDQ